ncbi:hypothetical protein NEOLI_001011 [Neolecta irregularis DAH-3]|uniref:Uncharacterized protein n=1 Tax=Neolecta irregularis (strain DAH-3) TaxID=1198029 RepID=A0A1U7LW30_NEOID|nr:hypothetical protein NEOLI_001011 [Neolecta irregularis DAH-3]|eukprot:OLL26828.1 hypothetical protein NEOLI_001011 [Neolecta irregularis DAH-3]
MPRHCHVPSAAQPDFVDSLATSLDMIPRPTYNFERISQIPAHTICEEEAESPVIPPRKRLSYRTEIPGYIQEFISRDSDRCDSKKSVASRVTSTPSFEFDHLEMRETTVGINRNVSTARSEPAERRSMYEFAHSVSQNFRQDRFSLGDTASSSINTASLSRRNQKIPLSPAPKFNIKRKPVPINLEISPRPSQRFPSPEFPLTISTRDRFDTDKIVITDAIAAYLSSPKLTQRIRLSSGRVISFSSVGDPAGFPVFCFLGMGVTRLMAGMIL